VTKSDLTDIAVRGYSITSYGSATERHFQADFWSPVGKGLEADGFEFVGDIKDSLHLPPTMAPASGEISPTAVIGADDAIVAVSLYIAATVGQWAVGKICDILWERQFRNPLVKMLKRRREEGFADKPMIVSFGVWYDTDGVYIGATTTLTGGEDEDRLADLIPEAQRRGLEWIEAHGITKPAVVFPIRNGEVAGVPTLSDSVRD
jgi:hypothetical protein